MKIYFQYGITIVGYFGQAITQQIHIIRNTIEIVVDFSTQSEKHFFHHTLKILNRVIASKDTRYYNSLQRWLHTYSIMMGLVVQVNTT